MDVHSPELLSNCEANIPHCNYPINIHILTHDVYYSFLVDV